MPTLSVHLMLVTLGSIFAAPVNKAEKLVPHQVSAQDSGCTAPCQCYICGTTTPAGYTNGMCGAASKSCSAFAYGATSGCYTEVSTHCDCATLTADVPCPPPPPPMVDAPCECKPCAVSSPGNFYGQGACGPAVYGKCDAVYGTADNCYTPCETSCDCASLTCQIVAPVLVKPW